MFDNELYKSAKLDDNHYHHARLKSDSEKLHYKPRLSKFQPFNKCSELFDLTDTDTVHDSPTSFANHSNSSL